MQIHDLEKLGLTKNESLVYYALLNKGMSSITGLIKHTKLHKQIIYDNLERLISKGIVSYVIKANRRQFLAEDPNKLLNMIEEVKQELHKKELFAKKIMPELLDIKKNTSDPQTASIYQGKKGIKSILEKLLNTKQVFAYGTEGRFSETFGPYFKNYANQVKKLKIDYRVILSEKVRKKRSNLTFIKKRFFSAELESPATTFVFGDNVAIVHWGELPFAVLIESKEIVKSYKTHFAMLWNIAKN